MRAVTGFLYSSEVVRFFLIGGANTFIHGCILAILVNNILMSVVAANLLAFSIANIFSYIMNCIFTFNVKFCLRRYAKFFSSSIVSLLMTLAISAYTEHLGYHYLVGFFAIVVTVPVMSFIMLKFWALKP